jgi:hypothetical protein
LLVSGGSAEWEMQIERLIDDDELRQSIARAARKDIEQQYSTERVLPEFLDAIVGVIRSRRQGSEIGLTV